MRLFGHAALHGLMVCVHAGVVMDLECSGMQGCVDLQTDWSARGVSGKRIGACLESHGVFDGVSGHD